MRVHVYNEEIGSAAEVSIVRKATYNDRRRYVGLRVWLEGAAGLHKGLEDDDRSAVTFWAPEDEQGWILLEDLCHQMMLSVLAARDEGRG